MPLAFSHFQVTEGEIIMALSARASSGIAWLGFGFAEPTSGSMAGADIVVVSQAEGGTAKIRDMYAAKAPHQPMNQLRIMQSTHHALQASF